MPMLDNAVFLLTVSLLLLVATGAAVLGPLYLALRWLARREATAPARSRAELDRAHAAQISRARRAQRRAELARTRARR